MLKQKIYTECQILLNKRMEDLNKALLTITESINNETKSSAGDKHETSRAMLQIEQEKLGKQLKELEDQKFELEKTDTSRVSSQIAKGSLIESDKGLLFIAIGLGKIVIDSKTVFIISPQSPLGKLLMGKKEKDVVEMNGVKYSINKLL